MVSGRGEGCISGGCRTGLSAVGRGRARGLKRKRKKGQMCVMYPRHCVSFIYRNNSKDRCETENVACRDPNPVFCIYLVKNVRMPEFKFHRDPSVQALADYRDI